MDTKSNTPTFRNTEDAFKEAIASGRLCEDPAAAHYAGDYMYMGTVNGLDTFKHSTSRQYLPAPVKGALGFLALPSLLPALLLGLLAMGTARASTACLEPRPASDPLQYVRVVDAEGKKHRFTLFILGEEDIHEFGEFAKSRKVAAMDPARTVYLKVAGDSLATLKDVPDCKGRGRAALRM